MRKMHIFYHPSNRSASQCKGCLSAGVCAREKVESLFKNKEVFFFLRFPFHCSSSENHTPTSGIKVGSTKTAFNWHKLIRGSQPDCKGQWPTGYEHVGTYPSGYQHAGSGMYVCTRRLNWKGREKKKRKCQKQDQKGHDVKDRTALMWLADEKKEQLGKMTKRSS